MTIEQVKRELADIADKMKPLAARAEVLNRERRRLQSIAFIEANGVRKDDVEMSSGNGKPWFGTVWEFATWLKTNSTKRFCEWNESIYFTAEIVRGRMDQEAPATIRELTT